jgi:polyisoprenoid-binding protein YceI
MTKPSPATVEIPTAGDYRVSERESTVSFSTRHMFGLGQVHGTFRLREGHIHIADPVERSDTWATIDASSVDSGNPARDNTVRSGYLHTEQHPDITFESTGLDDKTLRGTLTVLGRARPLEVRIEAVRPEGSRLRVTATSVVDRYEFGITKMKGMTGRRLTIRLEITADRC